MGAWAQALGSTLGGAGNDLAEAKFGLQDRDIALAQARAQLQGILSGIAGQNISQQGALQAQKIAAAPHVQILPTVGGGYSTVSTPAMGGPSTTQPVIAAPGLPEALTDAGIEKAAQNLPSWVPKDNFISMVRGLRDMGQREEALKQMATISNKRTPLTYSVMDAATAAQQAQAAGINLPPSQTGAYKVGYDAYTNSPVSFEPALAPSLMGSSSSTTDPLGFTSSTSRRKTLPGGGPAAGGQISPARAAAAASAAAQSNSPSNPAIPFHQAAGINPDAPSSAAARLQYIQNAAQLWAEKGIKPAGGRLQEQLIQRWMMNQNPPMFPAPPGSGELTPQAQQVLMRAQPVLDQIGRIQKNIRDLKLDKNNTPAWVPGSPLFLSTAKYKAGIDAPEATLGKDIADLSLGSLVEATSALNAQGGGSRSLPALMIALQHTPNPSVDSPQQIMTKLSNIQQRLQDVVNEANTVGTKHYRPGGSNVDMGNNGAWEQVADGPGGAIGKRNGKWYVISTGKEYGK